MALDKQIIISKAFEVLDKHGRDGLSTRRLADALGVSGPSLYWHFKTKRELFDEMAEVTLGKALAPLYNAPSDFDWRAWLAEGAHGLRREMLATRDGSMIFVGYRSEKFSAAQDPSPAAIILSRIGLDLGESRQILQIVRRFVIGWTQDEQSQATGTPQDRDGEFDLALAVVLRGAEAVVGDMLAAKTVKAS